jgi:hypothetical protein
VLYTALGVLFLVVGMLTIQQSRAKRREEKPWRGRWLIGTSQAFLGMTFLFMRPERYIVTAVGCLLSIIGMIVGLVIGQREAKS